MVITTLGAGAVGALLKPIVADLYSWTKGALTPNPSNKLAKSLESFELGNHVYKTINVKTLWNVEKEVSLFEFYYPSRVRFPDCPITQINSYSEIPSGNRYIIQGTAGQGKSIFLRYLYGTICFQAAQIGKIPIFIELRKLTSTHGLKDHIILALKQFGLDANRENLDLYLSSGKIVLLLDAFDEIDTQLLTSSIVDIEDICARFPDLQVTITSRPESGIQNLALFRVAELLPLSPDDLHPFLKRVCQDSAQAKHVHEAIKAVDGSGIENLLTTPLLVTLLVWLYRAQSSIPSTLTKFYEQLFDVMFYKHDQTKPGFKRNRYTNLDDEALKALFEGFCFQAKLAGIKTFDSNTFSETCRKAVETVGVEVSTTGLRSELIKTACLLIVDGLDISYIHRSVSEFYAARFVKNSADQFAQNFYLQVADESIMREWQGELTFLEQIDSYRFYKYFLIPQINEALGILNIIDSPSDVFSSEFYRRATKECCISFIGRSGQYRLQSIDGISLAKNGTAWFESQIVWAFLDSFLRIAGTPKIADFIAAKNGAPLENEVYILTYREAMQMSPELKSATDAEVLFLVEHLLRRQEYANAAVAREENKSGLVLLMNR